MNPNKILRINALTICILALAPSKLWAKNSLDGNTKIALKAVADRYKRLQNWEAQFTQETFSVGLGKGTFNQGHFIFSAPNRFRYSLTSPEQSDFISNGKHAWQITYLNGRESPANVRIFKNIAGTDLDRYLIILKGIDAATESGQKKLLQTFKAVGRISDEYVTLELEPLKASEITKITLEFKQDQAVLNRAILLDAVGNTTTVIISSHKALKSVNPKHFEPLYPKGSKVESF